MLPPDFYSSKINEYALQLRALTKRAALIAMARLAIFILLAASAYLYFNHRSSLLMMGIILFAAIFLTLIRFSASISAKKNLVAQLLFINRNEGNILNYKDNSFDDGSSITGLSMHAADLDIFGKKSVYHLLNRTTTQHGSKALAAILNKPLTEREEIVAHQAAANKLAEQTHLRQLITAYGLLQEKSENNMEEIVQWLDTPEKMWGKLWLNILRFVLPIPAIGGLLLYLSSGNPILLGLGVIANWLLIGKFGKYTLQQHYLIGKKEAVLEQYAAILKIFSKAGDEGSELLTRLKHTAEDGRHEIQRLSKLSGFFDQRLNLLVGFVFNSFFLYDIHVMIALEGWKRKNREHFMSWVRAVGEIEKLNSLATFVFNNPGYTSPVVLSGAPCIKAVAAAHPLIARSAQVSNDIAAGEDQQILLITGSNMSGKSTFLRTIGVNLIFAQCGLPVCAAEFSFTPMHILSSIRISDSLQENTSYFMAELIRLKEIIDFLSLHKPALVLIDEVLRGTNSDDKRYGSEELIKRLCAYHCLAFFATHDLSLSRLENDLPGRVKNYCFESTISNGELLFDYKLRKGVATNKNASFLMQKMGIIK